LFTQQVWQFENLWSKERLQWRPNPRYQPLQTIMVGDNVIVDIAVNVTCYKRR